MSLARRSSAVKIVVSTSRIIGEMSSSLVSRSIDMFSSEFSSPVSTSNASPSLASSSTRWLCSVFFRMSVICVSVATRVTSRCPSSPEISSSTINFDGSLTAIASRPSSCSRGTKLYRNIMSTGTLLNSSCDILKFFRSTKSA